VSFPLNAAEGLDPEASLMAGSSDNSMTALGEGPLEAVPCFLQTLPHTSFPFADFALHPLL
jgi:hypothetical protein